MGCAFRSLCFDSCAAMDANDWFTFRDCAIACTILFVKRIAVRYCNALPAFWAKQIVICRPPQNSSNRANHDKQCHGNCGTKCTTDKSIAASKCDHGKHHEDNA